MDSDGTGKVTDTYDYDAFGNVVGSTGTTANVYRYQGEALDGETGLYYMRARYYDPAAGRFLSVDPMADEGEHPYSYAGADPVNGHDPTGTQDVLESSFLMGVTLPSVGAIMAVGRDINCIFSLVGSHLTANGAIHQVSACLVAGFLGGGPDGPGPGPGPGPDKKRPCKCGYQNCCQWIDAHGADAIAAGLPEANALALTAIESGWGGGDFAKKGNSFFNLETCGTQQAPPYPPFKYKYQTGWMPAGEPNHWCGKGVHYMLVSAYANSRDSFMSAAARLPNLKETDPAKFAQNAVADGIFAGRDPNFLSTEQRFEKCLKQ